MMKQRLEKQTLKFNQLKSDKQEIGKIVNQMSQFNQGDAVTDSFSKSEISNFDSAANLDMLFEKMETVKTRKLERLSREPTRLSKNINDLSIAQEDITDLSKDTSSNRKSNRRSV